MTQVRCPEGFGLHGARALSRETGRPPGDGPPFFGEVGAHWGCAVVPPPCRTDLVAAARKAKPIAPGTGGVRYAAWAAEGSPGTDTLRDVFWTLADGHRLSPWMNASISMLTPKSEEKGNDAETMRFAVERRALVTRNNETKAIDVVANRPLAKSASSGACAAHRGFECGRQLALNVILLDVEARRAAAVATG